MNNLKMIFPVFLLFVILLAGCTGKGKNAAISGAQENAKRQIDSLQKIVARTAQTYHEMNNSALLQKLSEQSARKVEPFNSTAYRELVKRTDVNADSLTALVQAAGNTNGLLPLLLLRRLHQNEYNALPAELRAKVLTDALQESKVFNTWGLPHLYLEDASKALLECGKSALPALKLKLVDTSAAPVFGSWKRIWNTVVINTACAIMNFSLLRK